MINIDHNADELGSDNQAINWLTKHGTVDPELIWELGFYFGPMVALLPVIAIWIISGYTLSRKRHREILQGLGRAEPL